MVSDILAAFAPGLLETLIILIVWGIPVVVVVLLVRYAFTSNKERQKLRLEVGKLADELERLRKQKENAGTQRPSPESS